MRKRNIILLFVVLFVTVGIVYGVHKPLPDGMGVEGKLYGVPAESVLFFADRTFVDEKGERQSEQHIFDEVIRMIEGAQQYVLIDVFLFNSYQGSKPETTRALADELTQALVTKKQKNPDIVITVVSDPINDIYGGVKSSQFSELEEHGIPVVITDLAKLRDSNPLYSVFWRAFIKWFGNSDDGGLMPHPFQSGGNKVSLRSWFEMLNFRANHRKLIVVDGLRPDGSIKLATLVTSANPHDGSSTHSNAAVKVEDKIWIDVIKSEQATGTFSGVEVVGFKGDVEDKDGEVQVQLLTEGAIRRKIIELIDKTQQGDVIDVAQFYLSERSIIKSLIRASERGVGIRLLLDPNKDAFGWTKNGVPDRSVAKELMEKTDGKISIRWVDTHGEQFHAKMVLIRHGESYTMIVGSANFTRRNIGNYHLETDVLVTSEQMIPAIEKAFEFFNDFWENRDGRSYTTDYATYKDDAFYKTLMYRVQEQAGLSSF